MTGIQISLTGKERERLIDAVNYYIDMMSNGYDTSTLIDEELNNGLGRVMFKLYKGLNGAATYKKYGKNK